MNRVQANIRYGFVYVDQEGFDRYKPSSFAQLVGGFREYQEVRRDISGTAGVRGGNALVVRHAERVPLGTTYRQVVERVRKLLETPEIDGQCEVVGGCDGGGSSGGGDVAGGGAPTRGLHLRHPDVWG